MARLTNKDFIWSLYRGDEFLDVGTIEELQERTVINKEVLLFYSYPIARKRNTALILEKVCTIAEFNQEEEKYEHEL